MPEWKPNRDGSSDFLAVTFNELGDALLESVECSCPVPSLDAFRGKPHSCFRCGNAAWTTDGWEVICPECYEAVVSRRESWPDWWPR